jgi:flagellar biosynthesis protein FlhF
MNVKRFSARTSRDALGLVRQAFGEDAVVLSTRPCAEGVEVLAMAPEGMQQIERVSAGAVAAQSASGAATPAPLLPVLRRPVLPSARSREDTAEPAPEPSTVEQDVAQLSMSTLSFQDYVRERMLRRRRAEQQAHEQVQVQVQPQPQPQPQSQSQS